MLDPNEYVLRRVYVSKDQNTGQGRRDGTLTRGAYTPNAADTDGISFYREKASGGITPEELLASAKKPASEYVVVKIRVADIQALGLSIVQTENEGEPAGHCVVPEFTFMAYKDKSQRKHWIQIQEALCNASVRT